MMEFTWDIFPGFSVFGHLVRYYSLFFVVVYVGSWALLRWQIMRANGPEEDASRFMMIGILLTWLGGRLFHFGFYDFDAFVADPTIIFQIRRGGLASHGAALALILGMWGYTRWLGVSFVDGLDRFSFAAAWTSAIVRLGNLFNSEIVGRPTDQTWGVRFPRYDRGVDLAPLRHPSQLYEFALGMAALALLFWIDRRAGQEERPRGLMISVFFAFYFTGRFLVEFFKEYQALSPSFPMTMGQVLSVIPALIGYLGILISLKVRRPAGWHHPADKADESGAG